MNYVKTAANKVTDYSDFINLSRSFLVRTFYFMAALAMWLSLNAFKRISSREIESFFTTEAVIIQFKTFPGNVLTY